MMVYKVWVYNYLFISGIYYINQKEYVHNSIIVCKFTFRIIYIILSLQRLLKRV